MPIYFHSSQELDKKTDALLYQSEEITLAERPSTATISMKQHLYSFQFMHEINKQAKTIQRHERVWFLTTERLAVLPCFDSLC